MEFIVKGAAVDTTQIMADGDWKDIDFDFPVKQSSWIALRLYHSAHTNLVFMLVDSNPF